jgi:hypothetical protein
MKRITISALVLTAIMATGAQAAKEAKVKKNNGTGSDYGLAMVKFANKTELDKTVRIMSGTQLINTIELPAGIVKNVDLATSKMTGLELGAKSDVITVHLRGRDLKSNEMFKLRSEDETNSMRMVKVFDHNGRKVYRLNRDQNQMISLNPATIMGISIVNTADHKNVVKIVTLTARNFRKNDAKATRLQTMPVQQPMMQPAVMAEEEMVVVKQPAKKMKKHYKSAEQQLYAGIPTEQEWVEGATEADVTTP